MSDITLIKQFIPERHAWDYFYKIRDKITWTNKLRSPKTGEIITIHRKMAYVGDTQEVYYYSNLSLPVQRWIPELHEIKTLVENQTNYKYNSVLLNLYETGRDEIRWHSDKEDQLGDTPLISCINLGTARNFWFLRKEDGVKTSYRVENGDLLIMGPQCQKNYMHAILKEKDVAGARLSLTYRWVFENKKGN